jgi:hypothetical protein
MAELCGAALLNSEALELLDPRIRHLRAAQAITGQGFYDYLRLLPYAGSREHETCLQEWPNVTWSRKAAQDGDGGQDFKQGEGNTGEAALSRLSSQSWRGKPAEDRYVG